MKNTTLDIIRTFDNKTHEFYVDEADGNFISHLAERLVKDDVNTACFRIAGYLHDILGEDILKSLRDVGDHSKKTGAVAIHHLFNSRGTPLAKLCIHEAICHHLSHLKDIDYPHEDHKELSVSPNGVGVSEWGRGTGPISAHMDDIYETIEVDALALTYALDMTNTATRIYDMFEAFNFLDDEDIALLCNKKCTYHSGKNVDGRVISSLHPVVETNKHNNPKFNVDFRKEGNTFRMETKNKNIGVVLTKLQSIVNDMKPVYEHATTGSVFIVNNRRMAHARGILNSANNPMKKCERLLYRSKGQKHLIH